MTESPEHRAIAERAEQAGDSARPIERILIVRPSALGDVCRSVPVLVSLKRAHPDARIDWLVQDSFIDAIRGHPDLGEIIAFPRQDFGRLARRGRFWRILRWLNKLREQHYDLVLDCQGLVRSSIFTRATRAPIRIGYRNAPEFAWLGYTGRPVVSLELHTVDRMLALVTAAGIEPIDDMRLYSHADDRAWLDRHDQLAGAPVIVVGPTSRWAGKLWPADRFKRVVSALLQSTNHTIAIVGSPDERDQCSPLLRLATRSDRVVDLVGTTSIGQLMALVERAALVLAHDSALLHMAVGFARPAIGLYGPTEIARVGPYHRDHDVIQHVTPGDLLDHKNESIGRGLMNRITVAEVVKAAEARLGDPPGPAATPSCAQTPP